jgi:hypothetical protein
MPRKEFEAFTRLDASDVNSFLMDQSVMTFASSAARGSAIPTPVEGMYTHLEDTDRLQFWNGSAWTNPAGMTLVNVTAFSTTTLIIDDLFSSQFDNYLMVMNASATSAGDVEANFRVGGADVTGNYNRVFIARTGNGVQTGSSQFWFGHIPTTWSHNTCFIYYPAIATQTTFYTEQVRGGGELVFNSGEHTLAAAYTGIKLSMPTGSTGTVRTYGFRNA